jgi:hypothetical protein
MHIDDRVIRRPFAISFALLSGERCFTVGREPRKKARRA